MRKQNISFHSIKMLIDYGSNANMFMDNKYVYYLRTLTIDWQLNVMSRAIESAMDYVGRYVHADYKI